jgi:hypothetical protein
MIIEGYVGNLKFVSYGRGKLMKKVVLDAETF